MPTQRSTILLLLLLQSYLSTAFINSCPSTITRYRPQESTNLKKHLTRVVSSKQQKPLYLSPELTTSSSIIELNNNAFFILLSSKEVAEWRQYVPLVVSCLVILDILLGSPIANLALAPMKRQVDDNDNNTNKEVSTKEISSKKRERVDSDKVVQDALERSRNIRELRDYLETRKTDSDNISEVRRKFDNQLEKMDFKD